MAGDRLYGDDNANILTCGAPCFLKGNRGNDTLYG
jgi:hypothetical protein